MKRGLVFKLLMAACVVGLVASGIGLAQSGGGFELLRSSVAGGGGSSAAREFTLSGTAGQVDAGTVSGGDFTIRGGFWQPAETAYLYLPTVFGRD